MQNSQRVISIMNNLRRRANQKTLDAATVLYGNRQFYGFAHKVEDAMQIAESKAKQVLTESQYRDAIKIHCALSNTKENTQ